MSKFKCFTCRFKPGFININRAIKCDKCGQFFHKSCSDRISLNTIGIEPPCCRMNKKANIKNNNNNQVINKDDIIHSSNAGNAAVPDDDVSKLGDPNLENLWRMISSRLDNTNGKIDLIHEDILANSSRIETLEERIGIVEETLDNINTKVNMNSDDSFEVFYKEFVERNNRENNILIFNFPDSKGATNSDLPEVRKLFQDSGLNLPFDLNKIKVFRLGKDYYNDKCRPLKVSFYSPDHVNWIFKNKKQICNGKFIINADLTIRQRNYFNSVRKELINRSQNGEKNLYIAYNNKVPFIKVKDNK